MKKELKKKMKSRKILDFYDLLSGVARQENLTMYFSDYETLCRIKRQ